LWKYGVKLTGDFSSFHKTAILSAVMAVAQKFGEVLNQAAVYAFRSVYDRIKISKVDSYVYHGVTYTSGAVTVGSSLIKVASLTIPNTPSGNRDGLMALTDARNNAVHELGHAFANLWYGADGNYDPGGPYGTAKPIPVEYLGNEGFYPSPTSASRTWRQHPCNAGDADCGHETFADMFLGWTFDKWADDRYGGWRNDYMTANMVEWVLEASR
jgi:hypothetical protein